MKAKALTVETVAEKTGYSANMLRQHAKRGTCPFIKATQNNTRWTYWVNERVLAEMYGYKWLEALKGE